MNGNPSLLLQNVLQCCWQPPQPSLLSLSVQSVMDEYHSHLMLHKSVRNSNQSMEVGEQLQLARQHVTAHIHTFCCRRLLGAAKNEVSSEDKENEAYPTAWLAEALLLRCSDGDLRCATGRYEEPLLSGDIISAYCSGLFAFLDAKKGTMKQCSTTLTAEVPVASPSLLKPLDSIENDAVSLTAFVRVLSGGTPHVLTTPVQLQQRAGKSVGALSQPKSNKMTTKRKIVPQKRSVQQQKRKKRRRDSSSEDEVSSLSSDSSSSSDDDDDSTSPSSMLRGICRSAREQLSSRRGGRR